MADGDLSVLAGNEERLRLENRNFTRRRVAHVADRTRAAQAIELWLRERFRDVSHLAFLAEFDAVGRNNATRLLAAMLQRIQTQVSQPRSIRMTVNSEDATLFSQLADLDFRQLNCPNAVFVVEIFSTIHKTND
jgi:hypothetical protein